MNAVIFDIDGTLADASHRLLGYTPSYAMQRVEEESL